MPARMRGKWIGVERPGKAAENGAFLAMPEDTSSIGIIKYLGEELQNSDLKVGMKISYGKDRHEIRMDGSNILVMEEKNVYAVMGDESN